MQAAPNHGENGKRGDGAAGVPEVISTLFSESTPAEDVALQMDGLSAEGAWRNEVSDRLRRYQAKRRPRVPRYPSLQLKFDKPREHFEVEPALEISPSGQEFERQFTAEVVAASAAVENFPVQPFVVAALTPPPSTSARILEFPRSVPLPPRPLDQLADPVIDRPRILDVPEFAPTPPALGGISIEAAVSTAELKRPGFELPLLPACMRKRMLAGAVDGALVLCGVAVFCYLFFRLTGFVPSLSRGSLVAAALASFFWAGYEYLFLVYESTTPGLRVAKLKLSCFDGASASRPLRRWRVWSAALSGLSLGLGYAWCLLDEDQLCWHDRITRTYMAPR